MATLRTLYPVVLLVAFGLLTLGCASFPAAEPVELSNSEPEMAHLTVYTDVSVDLPESDPHEAHWDSNDTEADSFHTHHQPTEPTPDDYARAWKQEIDLQVANAGMRVVGERETNPVIEVHVTVQQVVPASGYVTMESANTLRWQVDVIHNGQTVDSGLWNAPLYVSSEGYESRSQAYEVHQQSLAKRVVNTLIESPQVVELARGLAPEARPSDQAVASADESSPAAPKKSADDHLVAAPQPNAHALVIGIEDYRDLTPTPGARSDAERFAQMLETTLGVPDQNIHLLTDNRATRGDVVSKLNDFQDTIPSDGRIYFFFSGHGTPHVETGNSYLLPYEGQPETLEQTGLLMEEILSSLEATAARDILAFVDACFSGSGERSSLPEGTRPLVPVQETTTAARVALFSSSAASEISGNAPNADEGLFTRHLIDAIASGRADIDGDGQISLAEIKQYVGPRVARQARQLNRNQNPTMNVAEELGDPTDIIMVWGLPRQ